MSATINNNSSECFLSYEGRVFKLLPGQIVDISIKGDSFFIIHTPGQNHIIDVSAGCHFIQGAIDIESTSALEIYESWLFQ